MACMKTSSFRRVILLLSSFSPIMVWSPGQSVSLYECFSRVIFEDEVEVLYEGMPLCLSSA